MQKIKEDENQSKRDLNDINELARSQSIYSMHQIDYEVARWQQRNEQIIHDVTSVKYKNEKNIFSYQFPRLNKKVLKKLEIKHIKLHLFQCKIST